MNKKILITSFNENQKHINEISNQLINLKLASCVNLISNVKSTYQWECKLQKDNEIMMCIKTYEFNIDKIKNIIKELHDYDSPEFITLDFEIVDRKFSKWFKNQIGKAE